MRCPRCHKDMPVVREDTSYDTNKHNKPYKRTTHHCVQDDIWLVLEVPTNNKSSTSSSEQ